jgi:hypothetical protein
MSIETEIAALTAAATALTQEVNLSKEELDARIDSVLGEANSIGGATLYKTYTELLAVTGMTAGQAAMVFVDTGTHTDPVIGGTVPNTGIFRYSTSPAGWERISGLVNKEAEAAAAEAMISKNETVGILDVRGVAISETGDPALALAFAFSDGKRSWIEAGWDGKPSPLAAQRIAEVFNFDALSPDAAEQFANLVQLTSAIILAERGVAVGETGDASIPFAITFSDGRRTWLEAAPDGTPTTRAAAIISRLLDVTALSTEQVNDLAERLPASASAVLPVPLDTAPQGAGREYPTVRKPLTVPIFAHSNQADADAALGAESIYWPFFFDLTQIGGSGVALFYSTDHAATFALSGIYLATAATPEGPYTFHGRIFQDAVVGVQTETPSVMYDATTDKVMMYYQEAPNPHQATYLATSNPTNFLAAIISGDWSSVWTRYTGDGVDGEVLGWNTTEAGDGHTGYLKPFKYGGQWHGHSLFGGGTVGRFGYWQSRDGYTWRADSRRYGRAQHLIDHVTGFASDYNAKIYNGAVINWNGNPWWIGLVGGSAAGGLSVDHRICTAPFGSDFARLGARVVDVTPATQTWEGGKIDGFGNAITWEGRVYAAYRAGGQQGGFGLLEIVL